MEEPTIDSAISASWILSFFFFLLLLLLSLLSLSSLLSLLSLLSLFLFFMALVRNGEEGCPVLVGFWRVSFRWFRRFWVVATGSFFFLSFFFLSFSSLFTFLFVYFGVVCSELFQVLWKLHICHQLAQVALSLLHPIFNLTTRRGTQFPNHLESNEIYNKQKPTFAISELLNFATRVRWPFPPHSTYFIIPSVYSFPLSF